MMSRRAESVRASARRHENGIGKAQRKHLGQHFSGLSVGKLLAHLALDESTRTVLDPMAGSGDLLDAACEAAIERGLLLHRLDGVEIDPPTAKVCEERLHGLLAGSAHAPVSDIVAECAFNAAAADHLAERQYDLVIANPPYVRRQNRRHQAICDGTVRRQLHTALIKRQIGQDAPIWHAVAGGYSRTADVSIPAWILAAGLVRCGGRLAIVAPATWRTRNYGDVIRYLMAHCFEVEHVVEGPPSAWFPDALVCTQLVVARRNLPRSAPGARCRPISVPRPSWIRIGAEAADSGALVGASFRGPCPEQRFAAWLRTRTTAAKSERPGIVVNPFDAVGERRGVHRLACRRRWYRELRRMEGVPEAANGSGGTVVLPNAIADLLPEALCADSLTSLDRSGVVVGQGLRTGCNAFFYVDAVQRGVDDTVIETAALFGRARFAVPNAALQPVVRRQADLVGLGEGRLPTCRVLDLRSLVLPEDMPAVAAADATYRAFGEPPPQQMPTHLADFVRASAQAVPNHAGKPICELSAVRTNRHACRPGKAKPRFWYMLPDFAPRHLPAAAVPRVNHGLPWTEANRHRRLLVDANFATLWAPTGLWSRFALKALLNSTWGRAVLEALCTPMGGGALKVEATHLRRLPIPKLDRRQRAALSAAGRRLARGASTPPAEIDDVVIGALCGGRARPGVRKLAARLRERADELVERRRS